MLLKDTLSDEPRRQPENVYDMICLKARELPCTSVLDSGLY